MVDVGESDLASDVLHRERVEQLEAFRAAEIRPGQDLRFVGGECHETWRRVNCKSRESTGTRISGRPGSRITKSE